MAQISARVTEEEKADLQRYCEERDIKVSQLIRWALRNYIEKQKTKETK